MNTNDIAKSKLAAAANLGDAGGGQQEQGENKKIEFPRHIDGKIPFADLTPDEKIERLRYVVKRLDEGYGELLNKMDVLLRHQHNHAGELVIVQPLRGGVMAQRGKGDQAPDPKAWL